MELHHHLILHPCAGKELSFGISPHLGDGKTHPGGLGGAFFLEKITNDSPKKSPPKAASVQDPSKSPGSFSSCLEGLIPRQNSSFEPGKGGWHLELSTGMSRICACPGLLDTGADLWQREVMGGRTPSFGEVF